MNYIQLCVYTTFSLSTCLLIDINCFHVLPTIMLQWTWGCIYLLFKKFLLFNYSYPHSPHPITLPCPVPYLPHSILPLCSWLCLWVFCTCSLTWPFPFLSPQYPPPTPLWSLSVCSLCQCLWLYFSCLFVLFIRLHLDDSGGHMIFVFHLLAYFT